MTLEHLPLVVKAARSMEWKTNHKVEYDDLYQDGVIGLMQAEKSYRPEKGDFKTWAFKRIWGAMIDGMRSRSPLPRKYAQQSRLHGSAKLTARRKLQREPNVEDIAKELGMTLSEYYVFEAELYRGWQEALEDHEEHLVRKSGLIEEMSVHEALDRLTDEQRFVVHEHYFKGRDMTEVGLDLGVDRFKVKTIAAAARRRLVGQLGVQGD